MSDAKWRGIGGINAQNNFKKNVTKFRRKSAANKQVCEKCVTKGIRHEVAINVTCNWGKIVVVNLNTKQKTVKVTTVVTGFLVQDPLTM